MKLYSFVGNKLYDIKTMLLLRSKFTILEELGKGKDGRIYLCRDKNNSQLVVVKVLSAYGLDYLDITKEYLNKKIKSEHLYDLEIISDRLVVYSYEKLSQIKTDPENFTKCLLQICDLEIALLKNDICYWDFGFIDHCNYLENNVGKIKLIDYGGNSFLLLNTEKRFVIKEQRRNLIYAKNDFLKLQFILHIYYYGLGRRTSKLLPSLAQNSSDAELIEYINFAHNELQDTIYTGIISVALEADLLTEAGWLALKQKIIDLLASGRFELPQESAHIDNIKFLKDNRVDGVQVRGYQNYNIIGNAITPLSIDAKPLWDTEPKFKLVDKALSMIVDKSNIDSFLDIGSNLGLYVFLCKLKYHIKECYGIDYNNKYVETCQNITKTLAINGCNFSTSKFSDLKGAFDCVLALGIIHHLFHRTEEFGSLKSILESFSKITKKFLIIEFPTEKDVKAEKWTSIPGRINIDEYCLSNFLQYSKLFFSKIVNIGKVNKTRFIYLLVK